MHKLFATFLLSLIWAQAVGEGHAMAKPIKGVIE